MGFRGEDGCTSISKTDSGDVSTGRDGRCVSASTVCGRHTSSWPSRASAPRAVRSSCRRGGMRCIAPIAAGSGRTDSAPELDGCVVRALVSGHQRRSSSCQFGLQTVCLMIGCWTATRGAASMPTTRPLHSQIATRRRSDHQSSSRDGAPSARPAWQDSYCRQVPISRLDATMSGARLSGQVLRFR